MGVLDAEEQAKVERHLKGCTDCQRLAKEYAEVAGTLPQALASAYKLSPPPEIKTRLLQSLATNTSPSHAPEPAQSVSPARRSLMWRRPRTAFTLGLAILLAFSLAWSFQLNVALAQERALRAELVSLIGQQAIVLEIVDSKQATKAFLRATQSSSRAYGKLWSHPDFAEVIAMAGRLPLPPRDRHITSG